MIKHVVIFKMKSNLPEETKRLNAMQLISELKNLKKKIIQIKTLHTGINCNPENDHDIIFDMGFESMDDLKIYLNHPLRLNAINFFATVKESKVCIDYEMEKY
ncbi:MAG: Dabb family protein [Bacteroidota bacterium]